MGGKFQAKAFIKMNDDKLEIELTDIEEVFDQPIYGNDPYKIEDQIVNKKGEFKPNQIQYINILSDVFKTELSL